VGSVGYAVVFAGKKWADMYVIVLLCLDCCMLGWELGNKSWVGWEIGVEELRVG